MNEPTLTSETAPTALLEAVAEFAPEAINEVGFELNEGGIADLRPDATRRFVARMRSLEKRLDAAIAAEQNPRGRADLLITRKALQLWVREEEVRDARLIDLYELPKTVFLGVSSLLKGEPDDADAAHALERLQRYAGRWPETKPATELLLADMRKRLARPELVRPSRREIEQRLATLDTFIGEAKKLLEEKGPPGWREPFGVLEGQLRGWAKAVTEELLPGAREDFRLPREVYALALDKAGVETPPEELAKAARAAYARSRGELDARAAEVAKARGLKGQSTNEILTVLRKEQIADDEVLAVLKERSETLQKAIGRDALITLPSYELGFRIATPGEAARNPTATIDMGALFRKDAPIDVIVPLAPPPGLSKEAAKYEDLTCDAMSWVLVAHEGRPGHELQFAIMKERGLSLARTLFAFNSVNIEGWGLYAEWLAFDYFPPEGKLMAIRARALREARAFLDIGLHHGDVTIEEARRVLGEELAFDPAFVQQELDRYTFEHPAQATGYFAGYRAMRALRKEIEDHLGGRFGPALFHDFVIAQGLLPPSLLRAAVRERFVK